MLGPLLFVYRVFFSNIFSFTKKICNSKKILFHKKKLFTGRKFEKCCAAKKDAQGSYYWAQKKFQPEKIKITGVAFISKK